MKLKNLSKQNEMVFRVAVPVKESLDDQLRMYAIGLVESGEPFFKRPELMEKIVTKFLDEDREFRQWCRDNPDVLKRVREEREEELAEKAAKKAAKNGGKAQSKSPAKKVTAPTENATEAEAQSPVAAAGTNQNDTMATTPMGQADQGQSDPKQVERENNVQPMETRDDTKRAERQSEEPMQKPKGMKVS